MKIKETWNKVSYNSFINYLKSIGDSKTKEFNSRIIDTKYEIIGIKTPVIKALAKDIAKSDIKSFLECVQDNYYEEVLIHGLVLSYIKDVDEFLNYFNNFILLIDNWALCDTCINSYKIMRNNDLSDKASLLIYSNNEFLSRVGYVMYLNHYLDDDHINDIIHLSMIPSDYYYVNMAIAWLLSCCFINYRVFVLDLLKSKELSPFVQNKTISKIRESLKVSKEDKELVKSFKIQ